MEFRIIVFMKKINIRRIKRYLGYIDLGFKFVISKAIFLMLPNCIKRKYDDAWIISERGSDARDNGFFFFVYVRTHFPKKNVYYIIDKKSVDYKKVSAYGNIIQHGGIQHYFFTVSKCTKISSHIYGYTPNYNFFIRFNPKLHVLYGKKVCLDHGVIKDLIEGFRYEKTELDLMIAAALPEYNYLISNAYGYTDKNCSYTGLARYDDLLEKTPENIVLVMPTWRLYYYDITSEKDFSKTEYFNAFSELLNDEHINFILSQNSCKLVFYPHYEIQRFINCFRSKWENVIVASFDDYDVHELLVKSKVLITDYSSVFFDFAYMYKPIICYQFDHDEYRKNHYHRGYFSHEKDGFGEVVYNISDLRKQLLRVVDNEFKMDNKFQERVNRFFVKRDNRNCERIYEAINRMESNGQ